MLLPPDDDKFPLTYPSSSSSSTSSISSLLAQFLGLHVRVPHFLKLYMLLLTKSKLRDHAVGVAFPNIAISRVCAAVRTQHVHVDNSLVCALFAPPGRGDYLGEPHTTFDVCMYVCMYVCTRTRTYTYTHVHVHVRAAVVLNNHTHYAI